MSRVVNSIRSFILILLSIVSTLGPARADGIPDNIPENVRRIPELGVAVPGDRATAMRSALGQLQEKIEAIKASKDVTKVALLSDVMIFERAVRCALDYNEFFDVKEFDKADALLAEGAKRADQLMAGQPEWIQQKGLVVRGYVSKIDNSVQPYGLVIPPTYAIDHSVPSRCDIWFHGRGEKLSEVNFLSDRMKNPGEFTPDHTIMLHPYGRYCNAFKFAGEVDVLEALEDVQKRYRIDEDRISVRGFSMGGAACWQFATHYSDRCFAANPGAGFSETPQFLKVFQKEELKPTPWEQTLWNLYDCDKWALNLTHCPTIAYSGENDSQKQAADVMEETLKKWSGIQLRHIIGRGMGHKFDPVSKKIIGDSLNMLSKNGRVIPDSQVQLRTFCLNYNQMHWATVDGLIEHWKPAALDVKIVPRAIRESKPELTIPAFVVQTINVSAFRIQLPAGLLQIHPGLTLESKSTSADDAIRIYGASGEDQIVFSKSDDGVERLNGYARWKVKCDGPYSDGSLTIVAHRNESGQWVDGPMPDGVRKRHSLQGPIDDAFMDSFIFVRPTGTAANEAVGKWAEAELTRAIEHWRRHFRGDARVVNDVDLTDEMIQSSNIVLWGDPKSNSVLAKIADKLPIQWTADKVTVGEKSYDAKNHAPILIHPNPLNLNRYVVLNSSFTFREYAYLNNARQVPMLPDWAVIDLDTQPNSVWPGKVVAADFFDEQWQFKP